jgi:inorganic pyrophosphatase
MTNYHDLPIGKDAPDIVECVVEIAKDTSVKYEYDEELNVFRMDRCLISSMSYPASYGFIPSTYADDGDALDILIYNSMPIMTGTVVKARVLGLLDMTDDGKKDYKLIGVPLFNPNHYRDISDLDPVFLKVTRNFFQHYKSLEDKEVQIDNWKGVEYAKSVVETAHLEYQRMKDAGEFSH